MRDPPHIKPEEERRRSQAHTQLEKLRPHGMNEEMQTKERSSKAKGPDSDEEDLRILGVNDNPLTPPATNP